MIVKAQAKINIGLKVLSKRDDGYHELESLMQQIALCDFLSVKSAEGISINCSGLEIPLQENLVYQAVTLLQQRFNISAGANITLYKNIPVGAGLAGGSSDAAAALLALNNLWHLNLSMEELMDIGVLIGADVPFCILGGTALARGIGEKLAPLPKLPFFGVVLAKPPRLSLSTASVFKEYCRENNLKMFSYNELMRFIRAQDKEGIIKWLKTNREINMLESVVLNQHPIVARLKDCFTDMNLYPLMSGSGPSVFALTTSIKKAREAAFSLQQKGFSSWASWTI